MLSNVSKVFSCIRKYFAFYEPKKLNLLLSLFLLLKELPVRWSRCFTLFNPPLNYFFLTNKSFCAAFEPDFVGRVPRLKIFFGFPLNFATFCLSNQTSEFRCSLFFGKKSKFDPNSISKFGGKFETNFFAPLRIIFARCGRDARPVGVLGRRGRAGCASNIKSPREIPQQFPSTFCATRNCYV